MRPPLVFLLCIVLATGTLAQQERLPSVRLVDAPTLTMPGAIDSYVPMTWALVQGGWTLFALASWGGIPALLYGAGLTQMREAGPVTIVGHPGHGVWIESVIQDESGMWYGYYHHEAPAEACGRTDRFIPRIGALRSSERGYTWEDLGIIVEAPPESCACTSTNRFVIGGVGDVSAMLSPLARTCSCFSASIRELRPIRVLRSGASRGQTATTRSGA